MAAHQALPSLGFSRQEHWSGLPFPSPMHESEKSSRSVVPDPQRLHGLQPTRLLRPWDFPGKSTGVGCHCLLRHLLHSSLYIDSFLFLLFQSGFLFFLSSLIAVARTSRTMLNNSGESEHPCLVPSKHITHISLFFIN